MTVLSRPSRGNVNEFFGYRVKPTPTSPPIHYGWDFGWGNGDEIYAAGAGVVLSTEPAGAYGNRTRIDHGAGLHTWYCHQSKFLVTPGQKVTAGQLIGMQGATGNTVGKHLHFEVRLNGVAVDPAKYLSASVAGVGVQETIGETEMALTVEEHDALMEVKRMLGVLLGWPGAATDAEVLAQNAPRDAAESRRMLAAVLTGSPAPAGAPAEAALWEALRAARAAGVSIADVVAGVKLVVK